MVTGVPAVTADADEAARWVAEGRRVVLIAPADRRGGWPAHPEDRGRGRLAVMVGDPADPDVIAAALAMSRELFPEQDRGPAGPPA